MYGKFKTWKSRFLVSSFHFLNCESPFTKADVWKAIAVLSDKTSFH